MLHENLPDNPRGRNDTQLPDWGQTDQQTANPPTSCHSQSAPSSPFLTWTGNIIVRTQNSVSLSTYLFSYLPKIIKEPENALTLKSINVKPLKPINDDFYFCKIPEFLQDRERQRRDRSSFFFYYF